MKITLYKDGQNLESIQTAWERRHTIARAYRNGATQKALAAKFQCSQSNVHHLFQHAKREYECNQKSPMEFYVSRPAISSIDDAVSFLKSCERSAKIAKSLS